MKVSDADIQFPALGFTTDQEMWGFTDLDKLTRCSAGNLKSGMQIDMEIIDSTGARWRVVSVNSVKRLWGFINIFWTSLAVQHRVEQDLEPMASVPYSEVQDRACLSFEVASKRYFEPDDPDAEYESFQAEVRKCTSIAEIVSRLNPDWLV